MGTSYRAAASANDLSLDDLDLSEHETSHYDDADIDLLLDTPVAAKSTSHTARPPQKHTAPHDATAHDAALAAELASLQRINAVVTATTRSLARAKQSMATVSGTVRSASTLLDTWTRILAQTEHNQRLLLHPAWTGASQDLSAAEADAGQRQRAQQQQQQQQAESLRRREEEEEEARRAQEEDENRRRRAAADAAKVPGRTGSVRGARAGGAAARGRGVGRARPVSVNTSVVSASEGPTELDGKAAAAEARARGRAAIMHYGRVRGGTRGRGRGTT